MKKILIALFVLTISVSMLVSNVAALATGFLPVLVANIDT
jgi:hypothetical protein